MARARRDRGFTLIEVMVAMAILVIGSLGLASLHKVGVDLNTNARMVTQAASLVQDLVNQMQTWDYGDDRLSVGAHAATNYTYPGTSKADHGADHVEAELETEGGGWLGVPTAVAQAHGMVRSWNVVASDDDKDSLGILGGKRVAVMVGWDVHNPGQSTTDVDESRWVVMVTFVKDPGVTN